ncbi:hypothetical protein KC351_g12624 [Hortaea werneckii]|nr:hypothetical protein KC351_g12624 [Hortaea werneckii]
MATYQPPTDRTPSTTTTENNDATVDTAPITTNTLERRNSLDKALQHRPDEQDLKDRHILLDTTAAPALQAKAAELERQRVMDNLRKGLAHRPEKEELVERNILAGGPAAPALQEKQRELEKHMRADSLEKQLSNRPKPEDLIKEGILNADENPVAES